MKLAYRYMLNQFLSTNLSLFLVLFLIVSMVFFIQLARITTSIEISLYDFFKLYSFMLPRILIFTLPISFFIALTLTLYRLSRENESIVYFTLGFSPKRLASFFLRVSAAFSAVMLVVALVFIPLASSLQRNFVDFKKTQMKLKIKTGEFGQKILDWMIFVEKEEEGIYKNVVMYHPSEQNLTLTTDKEQLIIAQKAAIDIDDNIVLKLINGKVYNFEQNNTWYVAAFDDMSFNFFTIWFDDSGDNFLKYWSKIFTDKVIAQEFVIYTLIALFPLSSTLFALSFGLVTFRYEKGFVYFKIFIVIGAYFGALSAFHQPPLLAVAMIFFGSLFVSFLYFKRRILKRY